jgi:type IV secretory pathway VirB6-like protein
MKKQCLSSLMFFFTAAVFAAAFVLTGNDAFAQATMPAGVCTTDPSFNIPAQMTIITNIVDNITCLLYGTSGNAACASPGSISRNLFSQIILDNLFVNMIKAALTLFVVIYGIAFMMGIVQFTYTEFLTRMIKFSIILVLLSPTPWSLFYNTFGVFFHNGTNWLISRSTSIALGSIAGADPDKPFLLIDYAIATAFSSKMFVTMIAMFFTGPYGWLFGLLVLFGLGSFVGAMFQAVWIYLMSMVIRAFLFGLAPLFIPFLLFSKTRHLFDGWLNQLVNTMLQPVLLFTFFAFFSTLVQSAMNNILRVPVCYLPGSGYMAGLPNDEVLPRFKIWMNGGWQEYARQWGPAGPTEFPNLGYVFPIDIMDVLIFLILAQLAWRFNGISVNIAKELSGASTSFNMPGAFTHMLNPSKAATSKAMAEAEYAVGGPNNQGNRLAAAAGGGGGQANNTTPAASAPAAGATAPAGSSNLQTNRTRP